MELSEKTRINDLLDRYPFLLVFLITLSPGFKALKNPILRKTMGKVATLARASAMGGVALEKLISSIAAEIEKQTGERVTAAETDSDLPGTVAGDPTKRQEALKKILEDLHAGADVESLKERFKQIVQSVDAAEVAQMEQQLINEGLPPEEIKRLCDVHVEIFKEALEGQERPDPPPGHPIHTLMKENRASEKIMSQASMVLGWLGSPPAPDKFKENYDELESVIDLLSKIDIHYTRKENQLFPMLEAHHFTGPTQVMWSFHDDIRSRLKEVRQAWDQNDPVRVASTLETVIQAMRDMIFKEEHILYPASLDMLTHDEWIRVKKGEADIGFAWVSPDSGWPDDVEIAPGKPSAPSADAMRDIAGDLGLDTGQMTLAQINLMLTHLPVDLTFVDEDDRVAFYSEGPERIFPRSPAIIGREVRNCHPPKSVHIVNQILDSFKSGAKDTAEFWIELEGKFIYIRYFAVRDAEGCYRGTLEVSQDLTEIRRLKGEKHLLDWE